MVWLYDNSEVYKAVIPVMFLEDQVEVVEIPAKLSELRTGETISLQ